MQLPTSTALLLAAALGGARASAGPELGVGEMLGGGSVLFPRQQGATGQNLQAFTGALGGIKADAVTNSGNSERPFEVDGDTFTDFNSAAQRSCDNQKNKCAQQANSGGNAGFEVSDCDTQNSESWFSPSPLDCCPEGIGGGERRDGLEESVSEKADVVYARANSSVQGLYQHSYADRLPDFDELKCRV